MTKLTPQHLQKTAYIYIRQSSMGQVRHHRESTERQYALKNKALALGWKESQIRVLDGDLGRSGTSMIDRADFKTIVTEVSLGKAGAVLALEASRLARSNADWHRLIEICGITGALIVDEDGCYDPADFNDGLLLGLKGTMAQAELHFIRARLQGGKLNKARKGELRFPLPVGYVFDEAGRIIKDPDVQVRGAMELVFTAFAQTGSAYGVVQRFADDKLLFPKRSYGGAWDGQLRWGRLTDSRVLAVLRNPSYAGVYAFGRYRCVKEILADGAVRSRIARLPRDQWLVEIQDHHEGYITWEQQLKNLDLIERNRTNPQEAILSGPAREGLALLQGLLICGCCGRRLTPRYQGNGGIYPVYECNWRKREGLSKTSCLTVQSGYLDRAVETRVLDVVNHEQIDLALEAYGILQQREQQISGQWKLRLQRAEYEAQLAQKQYDQVDPENRLVASTLEHRWNDALVELENVKQQIADLSREQNVVTSYQRDQLLALAGDLPRLWHAPTTSAKNKKRILQLLLQDITVEKPERFRAVLHIRWQGGLCEDLTVELPRPSADRWRHSETLVNKVRELAQRYSDEEIAMQLNAEKLTSAKGNRFTRSSVSWIRHKHRIPPAQKKNPNELTVHEVAQRFGVSHNVVYYWIERQIIPARRLNQGSPYWITIDRPKAEELEKWVGDSSRIKPQQVFLSKIPNAH
jgi:DNA invertase Pin-like site-specific DNA recombinase